MKKPTHASIARRRHVAVLAISSVVGLVSVALFTGTIGLIPPTLKPHAMRVAAASTHVFVDTPAPSAIHRAAYPVSGLIKRAEMLGRVMISPPVLARIGSRAGVAPDRIATEARTAADVPAALTEPGSEQRASEILRSGSRYHLEVQARPNTPILDVYAQAPSTRAAERLADAAVAGVGEYLQGVADRQQLPARDRLRLRQLGSARGGVVNAGMPIAIVVITFTLAFALTAAGALYVIRRRDRGATIRVLRPDAPGDDADWPRTTRLMPWTFAGFLAVLWLIPFNDIELTVQLPIDLKFDRLVLPFVAATWAIALLVGGRVAPRLRLTWIHAAVGAFVVCAFFSVILSARELNQMLELEGAIKQLPLLIAYVSLFVIASSAVRSSEIQAFLTYTLVLAVVCALGIIWEYRVRQNLFYDWSDKLLPGIFSVATFDTNAVDDIGRRLVRGPAALPLEAVAMLSMALPIALVSLLRTKTWRDRILYGLAACVLLAATFATYRKSALLGPLSVILTVAYFRRRELLKLAPLALVLVLLVHVLAPGALGRTTNQFDPGALGVTTVSDRASDYDAVRPDVWSHLAFGRGWGSYDHVTYRVLDSELLHRAIEMGLVGLAAFVAMVLSVVVGARRSIASRDPTWAPMALMGAAAAISFLVVSTLFDVLSFPHATYIFLYMAGLVSVVIQQRTDRDEPAAVRLHREHLMRRDPDAPRTPGPEPLRASAPAGHVGS